MERGWAGRGWRKGSAPGSTDSRSLQPGSPSSALTFMVGGAVSGGDRGRSGTGTSALLSSSCFLQNQTRAGQLPRPEPADKSR